MEAFNGGKVISIPMAYEYETVTRYERQLLTQHRRQKFQYLADRLLMVNSQLREVLEFVKVNVSEKWYKVIRTRILTLMMIRYMMFQMNPQWYAYRADLIFYANYSIIKNYLQRTIKVLIKNYGLEDKYYKLYITPKNLKMLSKLWAEDMYDTSLEMVKHFEKLNKKKD